ncbi:MAG: hypothetical protein JW863_09880 [Chitinispirillaceae bacterium]|nr:hypothetical protein [Chitinispirillaceae bacterium]
MGLVESQRSPDEAGGKTISGLTFFVDNRLLPLTKQYGEVIVDAEKVFWQTGLTVYFRGLRSAC